MSDDSTSTKGTTNNEYDKTHQRRERHLRSESETGTLWVVKCQTRVRVQVNTERKVVAHVVGICRECGLAP